MILVFPAHEGDLGHQKIGLRETHQGPARRGNRHGRHDDVGFPGIERLDLVLPRHFNKHHATTQMFPQGTRQVRFHPREFLLLLEDHRRKNRGHSHPQRGGIRGGRFGGGQTGPAQAGRQQNAAAARKRAPGWFGSEPG